MEWNKPSKHDLLILDIACAICLVLDSFQVLHGVTWKCDYQSCCCTELGCYVLHAFKIHAEYKSVWANVEGGLYHF